MKLHPKILYIIFFLYENAYCSNNTSMHKKLLKEIIDFKQSLTKKDFFYLSLIAFLFYKLFKIEKNQNQEIKDLKTQQQQQKKIQEQLLNLINILENKDKEQEKINQETNKYIQLFKNKLSTILKKFKKYLRVDQYKDNLQKQKKINSQQIEKNNLLENNYLTILEMLTKCDNKYNEIKKLIEIGNKLLNQKYTSIENMHQETQIINQENKKITKENQAINTQQNQLQNEIKIELQKLENFILNFYIINHELKKQADQAERYYKETHGLFNRMFLEGKIAKQYLEVSQEKLETFLKLIQKKEEEFNNQKKYLNQIFQMLRSTLDKIQNKNNLNSPSSFMSSSGIYNNNFQNNQLSLSQLFLSQSQIIAVSSSNEIFNNQN